MSIPTNIGIEYTAYKNLVPKDYLAEYYTNIILDEQLCLEFLTDSLRKISPISVALDFGSGPVVSHLIPLTAKAEEIHVAEYLADNRAEIKKWITKQADAYNWRTFTLEILRLEGNSNPTDAEAEKREQQTRDRITEVLFCDLNQADSLGSEKREFYPLVTSHYCADCISPDKDNWQVYMRNLTSLVKPKGVLIITACGSMTASSSGDFYRVGDEYYPLTKLNAEDIMGCFRQNGFIDVDIRVRYLPEPGEQGYDCLIFASGVKSVSHGVHNELYD
jgi:NNMT/PNMT/TEMT family